MFGQPAGGSGKTAKKAAPKKKPETKQVKKRRIVVRETVGEIENGVPIPKVVKWGKYPLEELQPGESFLVEGPLKELKKIRTNVMGATRRATKKTKRTFLVLVRTTQADGEQGVRCWRTDSADSAENKPASKKATKKASEKVIELTDEVTTLGACSSEVNSEEPPSTDDPGVAGPTPIAAPEVPSFKLFADD